MYGTAWPNCPNRTGLVGLGQRCGSGTVPACFRWTIGALFGRLKREKPCGFCRVFGPWTAVAEAHLFFTAERRRSRTAGLPSVRRSIPVRTFSDWDDPAPGFGSGPGGAQRPVHTWQLFADTGTNRRSQRLDGMCAAAGISPASSTMKGQWAASGCSYSRRLRLASSAAMIFKPLPQNSSRPWSRLWGPPH
jgi:hypothetical protein